MSGWLKILPEPLQVFVIAQYAREFIDPDQNRPGSRLRRLEDDIGMVGTEFLKLGFVLTPIDV